MNTALLDDDAFLNTPPPVVVAEEGASAPSTQSAATEADDAGAPDPTVEEIEAQAAADTPAVEAATETPTPETTTPAADPLVPAADVVSAEQPELDDDAFSNSKPAGKADAAVEPAPKAETPVPEKQGAADAPAAPVNYESAYTEALAPLKANGKEIAITSIAELRQLASMGANFTRKMQDIAPHRKILAMLENNGMLSEDKLAFYIDVEKKNPAALQKLLKDAGVDPLDIDVSGESTYQAGNHKVSDQEIAFRTVLEELQTSPSGQETISLITSTWDQASKDELWNAPEVMATIQQQRENGVYQKITTEIERQITLGKIPAGTPFIQAYVAVGNDLQTRGAFGNVQAPNNQAVQNTPVQPPAQVQVPVATRVIAPKPQVTNGAAASAAASSRPAQKRIVPVSQLDNMSDDDFLKNWNTRV